MKMDDRFKEIEMTDIKTVNVYESRKRHLVVDDGRTLERMKLDTHLKHIKGLLESLEECHRRGGESFLFEEIDAISDYIDLFCLSEQARTKD